jgi:hypothetical protein
LIVLLAILDTHVPEENLKMPARLQIRMFSTRAGIRLAQE